MPEECGERQEGRIIQGKEETFEGDGHVHYLESCDGFMDIYKCQNSSYCTFKLCGLYVNNTSRKLGGKKKDDIPDVVKPFSQWLLMSKSLIMKKI